MVPHTHRSRVTAATDSHTTGVSNGNTLGFQSPTHTYTPTQRNEIDPIDPNLSQSGICAGKSKPSYSQAYHSR